MSRLGGWIFVLGERMSIHLVLEAFSLRPLLDIHVFAMSRQDWRVSFSSLGSLPIMKMVVSSANRTVESGERASGKSFMNAEKRVGPRTDPCGTPDMGKPREEWTPDILVTCDRLEM